MKGSLQSFALLNLGCRANLPNKQTMGFSWKVSELLKNHGPLRLAEFFRLLPRAVTQAFQLK